jgi:hypothetical protein
MRGGGMWYAWGRREIHTGFLVVKPEGKASLVKPICRCENNIKMALK